jgi:hypothetical protein
MTFSNFLISNNSIRSLAGFDQLELNLATLQDGLEFALSGHDILVSLSPDNCEQELPALHPKSHTSITQHAPRCTIKSWEALETSVT